MSDFQKLMVALFVTALCLFLLAHVFDKYLQRLEQKEYDERVTVGLTIERTDYFVRSTERLTVWSSILFWCAVAVSAVFLALGAALLIIV